MSKDPREAARLLGAAALAGNMDAEVEYGIALFNGTGIAKNETTAGNYLRKAARKGSPIAQNRLAFMYATGRGVKADPVAGGALAPDRQGRRQQRPVPRRLRAQGQA